MNKTGAFEKFLTRQINDDGVLAFMALRLRDSNFTPEGLILEYAEDSPHASVSRDRYGALRMAFRGHLYKYDHWQIERRPSGIDRVTVYLKEVEKGD